MEIQTIQKELKEWNRKELIEEIARLRLVVIRKNIEIRKLKNTNLKEFEEDVKEKVKKLKVQVLSMNNHSKSVGKYGWMRAVCKEIDKFMGGIEN